MSKNRVSALRNMLRGMNPVLNEGVFCFVSIPKGEQVPPLLGREALGQFREAEGVSLIVPREAAIHCGFKGGPAFAQVTLEVYSDLQAVGLTAAVANALAERGISANVVAAYHHDHVFVDVEDGPRAVAALQQLQLNASSD